LLTVNSKRLFVRLFQRKHNWIRPDTLHYEHISSDLTPSLVELARKGFLIDESTIDTYEEIISLFRLPQLKDLAKQFHILNTSHQVKVRSDLVKVIVQHFKTQKGLQFNSEPKEASNGRVNQKFMSQCKKILGKCYKLEQKSRGVFVRTLMLYNLSSTYHSDVNGNESGHKQL
jgi:Fanconi-associated nuclease 1